MIPACCCRSRTNKIAFLQVEQDQTFFSHVANGVLWPFAPDPALLDAAIGKLVGAPRRRTVDDHATGPNPADGSDCGLGRLGEDAALKSVPARADFAANFVEIVIRHDADHRPEDLFAHDLHRGLDVDQHRRLELRALAFPSRQYTSAVSDGFANPSLDSPGGILVDEGANVGRRIEWVPQLEFFDLRDNERDEWLVERAVNIDRLHGNTALAGKAHRVAGADSRGIGDRRVL